MEKEFELNLDDLGNVAGGNYEGPIPYSDIDEKAKLLDWIRDTTVLRMPAARRAASTGTMRQRRSSVHRAASCGASISNHITTPARDLTDNQRGTGRKGKSIRTCVRTEEAGRINYSRS